MKRIIAALMLSGLFALPAMAQRGGDHTPEERAQMRTEKMAKELNLSADQKEAVYTANLETAKTAQADRAEIMKAHDAKMKEILTDEQYAAMKKNRVHKRKKAMEMNGREDRKMD